MTDQRFNASAAATALGVSRATLYRWIDRKWIAAPARDYAGRPVFTDADLERIRAWKSRIVPPATTKRKGKTS